MPNNNNRKKKVNELKQLVRQELGDNLNQELRDLLDAAVRKQWDTQQFFQRIVNTHYFRHRFPGLIEKNGTISNGLTGAQGVGVSVNSLASAIAAYEKGLNTFEQAGKKYGVDVSKQMFASSLKQQVSAQEFQTRLQAIDTVNSNPALREIFMANSRQYGKKMTQEDLYRAAAGAGDRKFLDTYEASQYQYQLGLSQQEARDVAQGRGSAPGGATFQSVDQVVQAARQNLQAIGPELAAQGITTPQLVKVLNNPTAFAPEMDKIQQALESRKMFSRPVPGAYPQQGPAGLAQYPQRGQAAYG